MKKIFKLAAIAVSVALATSLVACSSGDDDVVDASTPKYLLAAQINSYVDSITYEQNVSDERIKSLKTAHEAVMNIVGDCEGCLTVYFADLKKALNNYIISEKKLDSTDIEVGKKYLEELKAAYGTEEECHKMYVYKYALGNALGKVSELSSARDKVVNIGKDEDKIVDSKLNDRQSANMTAYIDAAVALKAALSEDDAKKRKTSIDVVDGAIKTFNELENKNVSVNAIAVVVVAVDGMYKDIHDNVYDKIVERDRPKVPTTNSSSN